MFEPPTDFMDVAVHALNSVVMLAEFLVDCIPVRILHMLYVMIFSVVYSLFTIIFWAAGGVNEDGNPYIYKILDYENGNPALISSVLLGIVFVVSPALQVFLFALYHFKSFVKKTNDQTKILLNH